MIQVNQSFDVDGNLVGTETVDTVAGTVTNEPPLLDDEGAPLPPRQMTPEEIAALEAQDNGNTLMAETKESIDKLVASVEALNVITNTTNATINGNPAATIKTVCREVKTVARQVNRLARMVSRTMDSTNTGTGSE